MTTTPKIKTDRDRFYEPCPPNVQFLHSFFESNRVSDFIDGMKAFADEWFTNYTDEENLPGRWHALVEIANGDLYMEADELLAEDDEEDDE